MIWQKNKKYSQMKGKSGLNLLIISENNIQNIERMVF